MEVKVTDVDAARFFSLGYKLTQVMPNKILDIMLDFKENDTYRYMARGVQQAIDDSEAGMIDIDVTAELAMLVYNVTELTERIKMEQSKNRAKDEKDNNIDNSNDQSPNLNRGKNRDSGLEL
jgi:hypothetical protein